MFARTKTVGQWFASTMVYCPPQPILLRFVMDKRPHLIHFRTFQVNLFRRYDVNFCYLMLLDIFLIDLPDPIFCFLKLRWRSLLKYPISALLHAFLCNLRPTWGPAPLSLDHRPFWYILPRNFGVGTPDCCRDISAFLPCYAHSCLLGGCHNEDILLSPFLLPFPPPTFLWGLYSILPHISTIFNSLMTSPSSRPHRRSSTKSLPWCRIYR